jgi:protein tyrosine/serine phosphatase
VDGRLWRGSQPDPSGFRALRDLGVRTVVSLRDDDEDAERRIVESLGMAFVNIPVTMKPFGMSGDVPSNAIARFFSLVDNPANGPVFLHCRRGADRTGTFVALYRVVRQGWDIDRAYDEARALGMRWWHSHVKDELKSLSASIPPAPTPVPVAPAAMVAGATIH